MKKILVIDDEKGILNFIKIFFEANYYEVITAASAKEAFPKLSLNPDIILLDIMMPDIDGIELCQKIRNIISCPILFLTAKTKETDKIIGFSSGADDYIIKPFSINELHARVEAHLRRENRQHNTQRVFYGNLWIDYSANQVGILDYIIPLTKKEYKIIELLSLNQRQVFSKELIYEKVWGYDAEGDANTSITEHIKRIRQKTAPYTQIETVWGVGYRWKN